MREKNSSLKQILFNNELFHVLILLWQRHNNTRTRELFFYLQQLYVTQLEEQFLLLKVHYRQAYQQLLVSDKEAAKEIGPEFNRAFLLLEEAVSRCKQGKGLDFIAEYFIQVAEQVLIKQFGRQVFSGVADALKDDVKEQPPKLAEIKEQPSKLAEIKEQSPKLAEIKEQPPKSPEIKEQPPKSPEIKEQPPKSPEIKEQPPKLAEIKEQPSKSSKKKDISKQPLKLSASISYPRRTLKKRIVPSSHFYATKKVERPVEPDLIINFCYQDWVDREHSSYFAKTHNATLIESAPQALSSKLKAGSIKKGMTVTISAHCTKGSYRLTDGNGNFISSDQLAEQMAISLGADKTIPFTISLIACQAGRPSKSSPSFAQQLVEALAKRGVTNVIVAASPTIMTVNAAGDTGYLMPEHEKQLKQIKKEEYEWQVNRTLPSLLWERSAGEEETDFARQKQIILKQGLTDAEKIAFKLMGNQVSAKTERTHKDVSEYLFKPKDVSFDNQFSSIVSFC